MPASRPRQTSARAVAQPMNAATAIEPGAQVHQPQDEEHHRAGVGYQDRRATIDLAAEPVPGAGSAGSRAGRRPRPRDSARPAPGPAGDAARRPKRRGDREGRGSARSSQDATRRRPGSGILRHREPSVPRSSAAQPPGRVPGRRRATAREPRLPCRPRSRGRRRRRPDVSARATTRPACATCSATPRSTSTASRCASPATTLLAQGVCRSDRDRLPSPRRRDGRRRAADGGPAERGPRRPLRRRDGSGRREPRRGGQAYKWYRRLSGDARKQNPIVDKIYKGI